jgi:hypothetical protein
MLLPTRKIALTTTLVLGALAGTAAAASPVLVDGNPTCADLNPAWTQLKYDGGTAGVHPVSDGAVSGTITIDPGSLTASFTASAGIDAVIVKAADRANVYTYDPDVTSASGLDTGGKYQISHVSLCYGPDATPPTTKDTPGTPPSAGTPQPGSQQQVLGEVFKSGTPKPAAIVAGRSAIHGPSSCVRKPFTIRVSGRRIASVQFRIDGRQVGRKIGNGRALRINPAQYGSGIHRVAARVRYQASSRTQPRTHRFVFQRCAVKRVQPNFAG